MLSNGAYVIRAFLERPCEGEEPKLTIALDQVVVPRDAQNAIYQLESDYETWENKYLRALASTKPSTAKPEEIRGQKDNCNCKNYEDSLECQDSVQLQEEFDHARQDLETSKEMILQDAAENEKLNKHPDRMRLRYVASTCCHI